MVRLDHAMGKHWRRAIRLLLAPDFFLRPPNLPLRHRLQGLAVLQPWLLVMASASYLPPVHQPRGGILPAMPSSILVALGGNIGVILGVQACQGCIFHAVPCRWFPFHLLQTPREVSKRTLTYHVCLPTVLASCEDVDAPLD